MYVCVCMYVCMYVRTYVCMYVMYVCMYVMYVCMYVCIHTQTQTNKHLKYFAPTGARNYFKRKEL